MLYLVTLTSSITHSHTQAQQALQYKSQFFGKFEQEITSVFLVDFRTLLILIV